MSVNNFFITTFFVAGVPQTAGSKRAFPFHRKDGGMGVRVTDDNPKTKSWQQAVASAAHGVFRGNLLDGPLALSLEFRLTRPKGHYGKHGLLPSAPPYPIVKPDLLKLTRAIEDALTGVLWRDDSQVVTEQIAKRYTNTTCGVFVTVRHAHEETE